MIIDGHVHMGKSFPIASFEHFIFKTRDGPREFFGPDVFIKEMDRLGIDMAVLMTTKPTDNQLENEGIAEFAQQHPDRFIGMPVINPLREDAVEELTKCIKK